MIHPPYATSKPEKRKESLSNVSNQSTISMLFEGTTNEFLRLDKLDSSNCFLLKEKKESALTLLWFKDAQSELLIDGELHRFEKDQIVCLTEFHRVEVRRVSEIQLLQFNRPFYCILDHDSTVGCKGILFFGASQLPILHIPEKEKEKFVAVWHMFEMEMESEDELQLEMLQMMLKRVLILCTRLYKEQKDFSQIDNDSQDLVREFNFLVEQHFREKHTVAEYADLLFRSPKTLTNLFAKLGEKNPLHFIQERRMLEARRFLRYTDQPIKEIAYAIGFEDIQAFSRFFKKQEGCSPSCFRNGNG